MQNQNIADLFTQVPPENYGNWKPLLLHYYRDITITLYSAYITPYFFPFCYLWYIIDLVQC